MENRRGDASALSALSEGMADHRSLDAVRAGLRSMLEGGTEAGVLVAGEEILEEAARDFAEEGTQAILLLAEDDRSVHVLRGLAPRGWGVVSPDATPEELSAAISAVAQGLVVLPRTLTGRLLRGPVVGEEGLTEPLTAREREVLGLLGWGLSNKMIARDLRISEHTASFTSPPSTPSSAPRAARRRSASGRGWGSSPCSRSLGAGVFVPGIGYALRGSYEKEYGMSALQQRLDGGEVVVLDGAMGTELERRGVPMHDAAWSAAALITHPHTVRGVHEDYIRAGADVIITNTFATARHVLEPAGMGDRFRELNARAVALAREAREEAAERAVFVAGSISTFTAHYDYTYEPRAEKARANYREQAEVLAGSGADVLALEMMRDLEQTTYAVEEAVATGLPVWLGFSCKTNGEGTPVLWDGAYKPAEALERIPLSGISAVSIMHTLTEDTPAALREVIGHWSGPVGAYPHSGEFVMPNWQFKDMISPEDFAAEAQGWLDAGARLIGGCCGIGPEHIRLLRERLPAQASPDN